MNCTVALDLHLVGGAICFLDVQRIQVVDMVGHVGGVGTGVRYVVDREAEGISESRN